MSLAHRFSKLIAVLQRAVDRPLQSATPDLTCEQVTELIAGYLDGALEPDITSAFEAHLRDCDDCVAFLNTYKRTIHVVQALRYEDVPAEMEARVRRFLETMTRRRRYERGPPTSSAHPIIARLAFRLRHLVRDSEHKRMILIPWLAFLIR
jgi:anti-sigma factor RsiW